jgi:hypothetical protein
LEGCLGSAGGLSGTEIKAFLPTQLKKTASKSTNTPKASQERDKSIQMVGDIAAVREVKTRAMIMRR